MNLLELELPVVVSLVDHGTGLSSLYDLYDTKYS